MATLISWLWQREKKLFVLATEGELARLASGSAAQSPTGWGFQIAIRSHCDKVLSRVAQMTSVTFPQRVDTGYYCANAGKPQIATQKNGIAC